MVARAMRPVAPVSAARQGLLVFAVLTIAGTAAVDLHLREHPSWMLLRMWMPGVASVLTRVLLRQGAGDISLRFDVRKSVMLALAWLYPILVLSLAYVIAWTTGVEPLRDGTRYRDVASSLLRSATWWLLPSLLSAFGEELGWRGYMLGRLVSARVPRPIVVSGLVWWTWHLPLVFAGQLVSGPSPFLVALLLLPSIMSFAFVAAFLRGASGSIWPPVVLHASFNAALDVTFDPLTTAPPGGPLWTGASGVLVASLSCAGALTLWRSLCRRSGYRFILRSLSI